MTQFLDGVSTGIGCGLIMWASVAIVQTIWNALRSGGNPPSFGE